MKAHKRIESEASGSRAASLFFSIVCVLFFPSLAFADTETAAVRALASRVDNGEILYYSTLNEAFTAAGGTSIDNPDEITLLADAVLDEPIIIESEKHLRLIARDGGRTIRRGANIDYPLFWIRADDASLTLGAPAAERKAVENNLAIDGGYLCEPSIEARTSLIAVNGKRSRLVMYGGVSLQNNYNRGAGAGTSFYENGGAVFIRTAGDDPENLAAFIMRGGVIQGNINNTQNTVSCGGGVLVAGFGLFVMEGGEILDNTAYLCGGGLSAGSRGSFKKTGGAIYGNNAPEGLRNIVINGAGESRIKGHAVCVALPHKPMFQFRDDTAGEDDHLSYAGSPNINGVFGEGDYWERPGALVPFNMVIAAFAVPALAGVLVFFIARTRRKKPAAMPANGAPDPALLELLRNLPPREKEVFDLLLTDYSLKEIPSNLNMGYSGAHFHAQNIYRKLGVKSRAEFLIKFK